MCSIQTLAILFLAVFACAAAQQQLQDPTESLVLLLVEEEVTCSQDSDCDPGAKCALSEAHQYGGGRLICCLTDVTQICRMSAFDEWVCDTVCTGRAHGTPCAGKNAICASGICGMDNLCKDAKFGDESPCLNDEQCESGVCGMSEALLGADSVCCTSGNYEFDGKLGKVCSGRIAGASCNGNHNICSSSVCGLDNFCKDEKPGQCTGLSIGCGDTYESPFGFKVNVTCDSAELIGGLRMIHCEDRTGCICEEDSSEGESSRACIGTPMPCEEHVDAVNCRSWGCTWEPYYPGICIDIICGPLYVPLRCSSYYDVIFKDSCETNLEKCKISCGTGGGCACHNLGYECALEYKFGMTQNICEGLTVCDHNVHHCGDAQSHDECLVLREGGASCDWLVFYGDWEERFVEGNMQNMGDEKLSTTTPAAIPSEKDGEQVQDFSTTETAPTSATPPFSSGSNPAWRSNWLNTVVLSLAFLLARTLLLQSLL